MNVKERALVLVVLTACLMAFAGMAVAQQTTGSDKNVTINLQDTPVRTAIQMIFNEAGLGYAFEGNITGTVTVNVTDVPFDQALQIILRSAGLTMRRENNTYMIGPKKEASTVAQASQDLVAADDTEITRDTSLEKIRINYADVHEVGAIFGSQYQGGGGMGGYGGGMMGGYGGGMGMMGGGMMGGYGGGMMGGGMGMGGYGGGMGMGGYGGGMGGYGGGMGGFGGGSYGGGYGGGSYGGGYGGGSYGGGRRW